MRCAIGLLLLLALAFAALRAGSEPAAAQTRVCPLEPRGLVARDDAVRVWRVGGRLLGCADGHRPRFLVRAGGPYPPLITIGVFPDAVTDPPVVDIEGTKVAYGFADESAAGAIVQDLSRPVREVERDEAIFSDVTSVLTEDGLIARLQIGPGGRLGAAVCARRRPSRTLGPTCRRPGGLVDVVISQPGLDGATTTVARSRAIDPGSLRASGRRLTWAEGGRPRSASFRSPRTIPQPCASTGRTVLSEGRVRVLRRAVPGLSAARAPLEACRRPTGRIVALPLSSARLVPGDAVADPWVASVNDVPTTCLGKSSMGIAVSLTSARTLRSTSWEVDGTVLRGLTGADGRLVAAVRVAPGLCSAASARTTVVLAYEAGDPRTRVLDWGDIPAASLRRSGSQVAWTKDGQARSADLARPGGP